MMKGLAIVVFIGALCTIPSAVHGVSVACMMAYEEGGARAVFTSLECPHSIFDANSLKNSTRNCQFATHKGRREYQEDRIACNLELKLPLCVEDGTREITVGIAAIFDGHGGDEASELASTKLLDYYFIHAVLTAYKHVLMSAKTNHVLRTVESSQITAPTIDRDSLHKILEKALLRTINDIDTEFSNEALENGCITGSTGTVLLFTDTQFLVANVGDSKALLCSQNVLDRPEVLRHNFMPRS
ncbi:probable protein phosphatase 2C 51 [Andrographis paniculata]|uniref:probable protein phosphatase 2C 51 n=1 Tax=Andrographis paniculata TaxID=175694 RepID=UPI0021E74B41|nr:probable protein phosphatase 2C 51 [Andrographis paniculata]